MSRKHIVIAAAIVFAIAAAGLVGLGVWHSPPGASGESASVSAPKSAAHADAPGLTLGQEERERAGIATAPAPGVELPLPSPAIATALPVQELIDAAAALAAARAAADRAGAALAASRRDFERLQGLHAQDRNVSDRALEVAEAAWRADDAGAGAARSALEAARAGMRGRWGSVLAESIASRGPLWRRLESGQGLLLRVVPTAAAQPAAMPATIEVEAPGGELRSARRIAQAPLSDPRIQGPAFFYEVDAGGLAPGMTLAARLGGGHPQAGALLPPDALLWWQGRQWAYVESTPGRFERREALAARRVEGGWFVPGFPASTVASRGAQALLSQELRAAVKAGEEER